MVLRLDSAGDDVVIPPIPADQVPEWSHSWLIVQTP
jgi:hypothetical protein